MKKILIIEDDPIVAHIYQSRLEKEGFEVESCSDGQSGFFRIHEFHPDAILLDLMLPKINGVDIIKKIRAQGQFAHVPVIVFTNAFVPNMIQEAMSAGASHVCNKATLTPRQVLDLLSKLLERSKARTSPGETQLVAKPVAPATPPASRGDPLFRAPQNASPLNYEGSPVPHRGYVTPDQLQSRASKPKPTATPSPMLQFAAKPFEAADDDAAFQAELTASFNASKIDTITTLRRLLHGFTKTSDEAGRLPHLVELYRRVHALTGSAGIAGYSAVSQLTAALEVLLRELHDKPKNINPSTLRTVASSVDFIAELFKSEVPTSEPITTKGILVVDDEVLSRRAVSYALEKAGLKSVSIEDPLVALKLSTENVYDLIFLDVQMPGMDGFELCAKIRELPTNRHTPVIFVTSLTDFKSRARSSLSGGTDLIAKPFMFIELAVKALTHVIRTRVLPMKQAA